MPWVATDRDGQTVYVYRDEPKSLGAYFTGAQYVVATDFPNPPAPGEKREFRWAEVVAEPAPPLSLLGRPVTTGGVSMWLARDTVEAGAEAWLFAQHPNMLGGTYNRPCPKAEIPDALLTLAGIEVAPGECVEVNIVRAEPARRTPSTGLPPVCEGAAAMKIDPPGSVAAPHAVVPDSMGYSPDAIKLGQGLEDDI